MVTEESTVCTPFPTIFLQVYMLMIIYRQRICTAYDAKVIELAFFAWSFAAGRENSRRTHHGSFGHPEFLWA